MVRNSQKSTQHEDTHQRSAHHREGRQNTVELSTEVLEAVAEAVKQMAQNMPTKPKVSGLERLSVPSWDGSRKTYDLEE